MFLKKLEIVGFKSFARRTKLDFSENGVFKQEKNIGITAIVGPNGSGKSNIADALKWVMGEQSMKSMRGKKSQDVIFAGSGKKSQLGSAQVSLFLDNSDKKIPIDFEEVVVTRKIYRDGDGEYLINNSKVRLIDVAELLAKAGIGQRSYCIINQGMADQVLNATPSERRSILEEAAGVKEFQLKKERSERKLKSTKANLERVKGLLLEIEPHLRILRRQSQKAQKGEEYRIALHQKQQLLFGYLWSSFERSRNQAEEAKEILGRELMQIQREVDEMRDKLQKESKQSSNSGEEISKLEQLQRQQSYQLSNLERSIIVEEGKLELEKERAKNIQLVDVIPVGAELIKKRLSAIKQEQDQLINKIENLENLEDLQELKEYARSIAQEIYELYEGIAKGRIEKRKPQEDVDRQKTVNLKKVHEIMEQLKSLRQQKEILEKENLETRQKIDYLTKIDREERRATIELEDRLRRRQFELDKIKDRHNDAKIELAKIQVREEDLVNRIQIEAKTQPDKLSYGGEAVNVGELERDISRLKIQLEQIGGIDDTVLEEYTETEKRFDFLKKESEDLHEAMKRLREVIREMDKKVKESFEETYKTINREFNNYFKIIFNGGRADLKRVETKVNNTAISSGDDDSVGMENLQANQDASNSDDEIETQMGIEISACPPGKKITSLGMLSGGERSLTSLALLFAIISHNPPPFAILDEVEAALDEANSKRFSRILGELCGRTQFVLITHNRQTMKEASMLYGVTMGDDGISKLLSVKLDQVGNKGEIKAD